ncbi:Scr1 family TA system antitoxin-like transcriptional regulator [Streptomyces sp. NA04227]|uniref:helix-turn-helix domain-containing protein n=1 Tax=Streptomyces sp. NA04227 TaxID=2742136 RepID=UPI0034CF3C12
MKLVGAQLALLRAAAGYTQASLAAALNVGEDTVASIEQGRRPLFLDVAQQVDQLLKTKGVLEVAVDHMPEVDRIPAWAEEYLAREQEALTLSWYENQVLPGLLQTPDYARAVFRSRVPRLSEEEIETDTQSRIERQQILYRSDPPTLSFVIWEPVLRDNLGGSAVRREQLEHLRRCADLPNLTIQIMPLGRTSHAGLNGPFILLETPDHQSLAYSETQRGSHLISDPSEVSILSRKYAMLRTQALNSEDSKSLMDELLGEQ